MWKRHCQRKFRGNGLCTEVFEKKELSRPITRKTASFLCQSTKRKSQRYQNVVNSLSSPVENVEEVGKGWSPLAELLRHLREQWNRLPKSIGMTFEQWLEETQPLEIADLGDDEVLKDAVDSLDTLDSFLLPILVELKQLYRTSLPPRSGDKLLKLYSPVSSYLEQGYAYTLRSKSDRFEFIRGLVEILRSHPRFKSSDTLGSGKNAPTWEEILEWWLNPTECQRPPPVKEVSRWYDFVYGNFDYRFNWGFSSLLSIAFDEAHGGSLKPLTLTDWPSTRLPWIAFWIKELIV